MKDLSKLQAAYDKEIELSRKHKIRADEIKAEIAAIKNKRNIELIKQLNLSEAEYTQFKMLIKEDRAKFLDMLHTKQELATSSDDRDPDEETDIVQEGEDDVDDESGEE